MSLLLKTLCMILCWTRIENSQLQPQQLFSCRMRAKLALIVCFAVSETGGSPMQRSKNASVTQNKPHKEVSIGASERLLVTQTMSTVDKPNPTPSNSSFYQNKHKNSLQTITHSVISARGVFIFAVKVHHSCFSKINLRQSGGL